MNVGEIQVLLFIGTATAIVTAVVVLVIVEGVIVIVAPDIDMEFSTF